MDDNLIDGMPDESGLMTHLKKYKGATAFEIPTTDNRGRILGNHGDTLMYRVYRDIAVESGIPFTSNLDDADILVLPPSGALLENYSFPSILRERLARLPDIPLVIFPSSTLFRENDPEFMFRGRTAPTLLMLREEYSYRQLEVNWKDSLAARHVSIELDHDVVASGHARVESILKDIAGSPPQQREGSLVVARLDIEARTLSKNPQRVSRARQFLITSYRGLPSWARRLTRSRVVTKRQRDENQLLLRRLSDSPESPLDAPLTITKNSKDISDPSLASFPKYAQSILDAERVITNRLHVALPAAALGTETYLMNTGYHKLRGVYERSLKNNSNVRLISSDE